MLLGLHLFVGTLELPKFRMLLLLLLLELLLLLLLGSPAPKVGGRGSAAPRLHLTTAVRVRGRSAPASTPLLCRRKRPGEPTRRKRAYPTWPPRCGQLFRFRSHTNSSVQDTLPGQRFWTLVSLGAKALDAEFSGLEPTMLEVSKAFFQARALEHLFYTCAG